MQHVAQKGFATEVQILHSRFFNGGVYFELRFVGEKLRKTMFGDQEESSGLYLTFLWFWMVDSLVSQEPNKKIFLCKENKRLILRSANFLTKCSSQAGMTCFPLR